jgi:hypothetical protein
MLCDECWKMQVAHRKKLGADHEKMDYDVVVKLRQILEPPTDSEKQKSMHEADEHTAWFGVSPNNTHFWESGRYTTIMAGGRERYPHLVSFIGQTGINRLPIYRASVN